VRCIATRSLLPCVFRLNMLWSASLIEAIAKFAIRHLAKSFVAESDEQGLLRASLAFNLKLSHWQARKMSGPICQITE
jgi:hypothetical protein